MHKDRARVVLSAAGLRIPRAQVLNAGDALTMGAPCVVKPMRLGSSVGLAVVKTDDALQKAVDEAFEHDSSVLIEHFVAGREYTAGVLEHPDGRLLALPIVEIRPLTSDFFDFHAKYTPGACDEICPAPISDDLRDQLRQIGIDAHVALGCRGMSRTDVIVDDAGVPWVLETNTIPGMTPTSLLPQAAAAAGISFSDMLNMLLDCASREARA
jgi:D-alanine-D-alanine ligase